MGKDPRRPERDGGDRSGPVAAHRLGPRRVRGGVERGTLLEPVLRELGVGAADLRRRGLAGDVDAIRRRLKLAGPHRATIVLTRVADQPWGLICADPGTPLARSGAGKG